MRCSCYVVCVPCSADSSLCCTPQLNRGSSFPDSVASTPAMVRSVSVEASPKDRGPSSSGVKVSTRTTKRTRSDDVTSLKSGADTRSSKRSKSESLLGSRKVGTKLSEVTGVPASVCCVCLCIWCACVCLSVHV